MAFDVHARDGVVTIKPPPQFNFEVHRTFREACKKALADAATTALVVDFCVVEYIDSSVLGSLIFAKDCLCKNNQTIRIVNCHGVAREIMEVASFHRIFEIT